MRCAKSALHVNDRHMTNHVKITCVHLQITSRYMPDALHVQSIEVCIYPLSPESGPSQRVHLKRVCTYGECIYGDISVLLVAY